VEVLLVAAGEVTVPHRKLPAAYLYQYVVELLPKQVARVGIDTCNACTIGAVLAKCLDHQFAVSGACQCPVPVAIGIFMDKRYTRLVVECGKRWTSRFLIARFDSKQAAVRVGFNTPYHA